MSAENPEVSANAGSTEGNGSEVAENQNATPVSQNPLDTTKEPTDNVAEGGEVKEPEINWQERYSQQEQSYKELQRKFTEVTQDRSSMRKEFQALQSAMKELQSGFAQATKKPLPSPEEFVTDIQKNGVNAIKSLLDAEINPVKESYRKELESRDGRIINLEASLECVMRRNDPDRYPDFAKLEPEIKSLVETGDVPIDFTKPTGEIIDTLYNLVRSKHSSEALKAAEQFGHKKAEERLANESKSTVAGGGKTGGVATPNLDKVKDINKLREIVAGMHGVADRD